MQFCIIKKKPWKLPGVGYLSPKLKLQGKNPGMRHADPNVTGFAFLETTRQDNKQCKG